MSDLNIKTDDETIKLFEVVRWCLVELFSLEYSLASILVTDYYNENKKEINAHPYYGDDYYHHEGPYKISTIIYYCKILKGDIGTHYKWIKENGLNLPPIRYFEFWKSHCNL